MALLVLPCNRARLWSETSTMLRDDATTTSGQPKERGLARFSDRRCPDGYDGPLVTSRLVQRLALVPISSSHARLRLFWHSSPRTRRSARADANVNAHIHRSTQTEAQSAPVAQVCPPGQQYTSGRLHANKKTSTSTSTSLSLSLPEPVPVAAAL
ncbi:hypothetical protein BV20DRAFT_709304 [Pilatotrama ljubarskyi]|nr:hypothetical protein BV20DRAFT_709304 [Pilatotrama ljubarskyi]